MNDEERLKEVLLEGYNRAGIDVGYWAFRYLQSLRKKGAIPTAKRLLTHRGVSEGFLTLHDAGRLDLAVETIVLRDEFSHLFTAAELREARARLADHGYTRKPVSPENNFPEELPEDKKYKEGAVRKILTNVYERDPAARVACLKKHGNSCKACGLSFEKQYGVIGKGFIHVHHKKPLGAVRAEYQLNPETDLVPVCPNCHAMLHTSNPPLSIDELKAYLKKSK